MSWIKSLKILDHSDIEPVLKYGRLITDLEEAFGKFSQTNGNDSGIIQPVRSTIIIPENNGFFGSMPVYARYNNVLATKLITCFPEIKEGPSIRAAVVAFDAVDGKPVAILDGHDISSKRTAAASAVATKHLVNGKPQILAVLGSGVQGRSHCDAMSFLYDFKEIRIWNYRKVGAEKLAGEIGKPAVACDTVEEAVKDADIIVTATAATTPILKEKWVKKGAHINAVGACRPNYTELDSDLMHASVVYVDSRDAALKESGDIILSKAPIYAEIGEVINETKEARGTETTIFKSLGMALEDAVAVKIILDHFDSIETDPAAARNL